MLLHANLLLALLLTIASYVLSALAAIALYVVLRKENKKRERSGLDEQDAGANAFSDLTDKENLHFRYVL